MAKMNDMMLLMSGFIALIIAVALVTPLANSGQQATGFGVATETVDITAARMVANNINESVYFHLANGCPNSNWRSDHISVCALSNMGITNSSGSVLADPTDVVFVANGAVCSGKNSGDLHFVNSTQLVKYNSNSTTVKYQYCPEGYLTSSWGASAINLTMGFFALAAFLTSVGMFYALARNNGMFD